MTKQSLINKLIERKLIPTEVVLTGKVSTTGLGHVSHMIEKELIMVKKTSKKFVCQDILGRKYDMLFEHIDKIDGMDLARFASVYNIKPDGSDKIIGKKRGRKPKNLLNTVITAETKHGEDQRTNDNDQTKSTS